MKVTGIDVADTGAGAKLVADVVWDKGGVDRLKYTYRTLGADHIATPGDALTAAVLLPAMAMREDVRIDAPVSAALLRNTAGLAEIWTRWVRRWHPSRVTAAPADRSALEPTAVAACFSGGLDSFYTVLREHPEPITTLVTLRPHDQALHPTDWGATRMDTIAKAAGRLGKRHIIVDSNILHWGFRYLPPTAQRGTVHHGAVLASIVLGLGSFIRRCYIAGSETIDERAWGSHPRVDPLWSTEALEFVHDDEQRSRTAKYPLVARSDAALDYLLVCNEGPRDVNCRVCDKCQAAGLMLHIAGVLHRSKTLGPVTPDTIRRVRVGIWHHRIWMVLREQVAEPEFKRAIGAALRGARARRLARPAGALLRRAGLR